MHISPLMPSIYKTEHADVSVLSSQSVEAIVRVKSWRSRDAVLMKATNMAASSVGKVSSTGTVSGHISPPKPWIHKLIYSPVPHPCYQFKLSFVSKFGKFEILYS